MRKIVTIFLSVLLALPLMAEHTYTLVLDAGHGGKDPGAVGKFSKEKDLNLSLVLKMGELIAERYPDVKVVYTRSTDVFIPLQTRADIANKANADLFLSIHTNSAEKKEPRGVETFILGTDRLEANLDVAMRENAVIKLESDYNTTYQGFDPNSIDSYIMFELMQNSHMEQSLLFAEQVQQRFVGNLNREDRGVRQAAFWVLLKTACPSVLFEMGFISNPEEERFLNQPASIAQMANALVNAFGAYTHKQAVKKETLSVDTVPSTPAEVAPSPSTPVEVAPSPSVPAETVKHVSDTVASCGNRGVILDHSRTIPDTIPYYGLQVCASRTPLAPNDPKLHGIPCESRQIGEWYKYFAIIDPDRSKVAAKQQELKSLFPDCWIVKLDK